MADQTVVYEFEIKLCILEDKYWRRIEITSVSTVAKLAYAIMASFELSGSHLFSVRYINSYFEFYNDNAIQPCDFKLKNLNLSVGDKLKMVYDFGADLNFAIKLTEIKEFKRGTGTHYPYALSGAGTKIPEDMFIPELIEELDSLYKEYDSELDNVLLKGKIQILKDQYESK